MEARLFLIQRVTAGILAPLVLVHIGLVLFATRQGLSAEAILGRTEGSLLWALFYGLFVLAAALHGPIGLRTVVREWTPWRGRSLDWAAVGFGLVLLGLGIRAVGAVIWP